MEVDSHNRTITFSRFTGETAPSSVSMGTRERSWPRGVTGCHGLAVDSKDNVWVTDTGHHQVFKVSHNGELLMTVGTKGVPGLDGTHLNRPTDVVVAPTGEFYVSDGYGNSRVAKFSADGKFLFDWGSKGTEAGEFDLPHGIALDAKGRVYVADRTNNRIQVFKPDGTFLHQWQSEELGRPWGLTVGRDG